jgi:hypothetical protein
VWLRDLEAVVGDEQAEVAAAGMASTEDVVISDHGLAGARSFGSEAGSPPV